MLVCVCVREIEREKERIGAALKSSYEMWIEILSVSLKSNSAENLFEQNLKIVEAKFMF